jgi:hypothetical protein
MMMKRAKGLSTQRMNTKRKISLRNEDYDDEEDWEDVDS